MAPAWLAQLARSPLAYVSVAALGAFSYQVKLRHEEATAAKAARAYAEARRDAVEAELTGAYFATNVLNKLGIDQCSETHRDIITAAAQDAVAYSVIAAGGLPAGAAAGAVAAAPATTGNTGADADAPLAIGVLKEGREKMKLKNKGIVGERYKEYR